ncbi:S8 family peptidase [Rouxiella badensis]|uniref:S8 family peptidase n=1 Tax=Rouxiella badensis TaxID=1646377 RepID=UPI001D14443E|nr:S8 family peptidase [Rouxiella badensis]MCC3701670.1 S8 family peptidase [Rouxiella badensis]
MANDRKHIDINRFISPERFKSKNSVRNASIPLRNRSEHGGALQRQYLEIIHGFEKKLDTRPPSITEDIGIYVDIIGHEAIQLPIDKLDNRDFKLCLIKNENGIEIATVFIPESKRTSFLKKITDYLDPKLDRPPDKNGVSHYANHPLIDSISEIRLASLRSFWTDDPELFPTHRQAKLWWELWLKKTKDIDAKQVGNDLAERLNAELANSSLSFFDSVVLLIKCSASDLESAPELIANLEELRLAKDTPVPIVRSSQVEQSQWAEDIVSRIQVEQPFSCAVSILDTGINYHHTLLQHVSGRTNSECWQPDWPHYSLPTPANSYIQHGSLQAGLAAFGNLLDVATSQDPILVLFGIESGRILPPSGHNEPSLYGDITISTISKLEISRAYLNRVYSLAVTYPESDDGGQPSSWSAAIDKFASGIEDNEKRLFIISAGNNREVNPHTDYWEQVTLAQIEDPAQSWNALTVGAYTEFTGINDPSFKGWSAFAKAGDVGPSSRSSNNWSWKKQAPFKPDVVAEGGNQLLSPCRTMLDYADDVSLLTTSGYTKGRVFGSHNDTSAACALVSRQAALLRTEYPYLWAETIRGLIVHSAEWTPQMMARYGILCNSHSPKVAKESLLRNVGYGVPDITRSRYSANHALTLIAESTLKPFTKEDSAPPSSDPKLHEMNLHQLPWPIESLRQLPPETSVSMRVTLSYFIEPNPGRRGYRSRYSYQSHGLRFKTIRPGQPLENFKSSLNALAMTEDYNGPEGDNEGWFLGSALRTRGSIHSDKWNGTVADLIDMHTIAIFPVGGWWKYRTGEERYRNTIRYSLMVSIHVPEESVDIYTEIENLVSISISS